MGDSRTRASRWLALASIGALARGVTMAYDRRPIFRSRVAEPAEYEAFGLGAEWNERIVTGIVVAAAVMVVAMIAVLMGMA
jgi:hypothetical protein